MELDHQLGASGRYKASWCKNLRSDAKFTGVLRRKNRYTWLRGYAWDRPRPQFGHDAGIIDAVLYHSDNRNSGGSEWFGSSECPGNFHSMNS